ncbi:Aste57867_13054 [Aphanomyces stellatus]|uniref:Aste57867_13054 protein n=1 Tax=Aphanomyces stellatus TaxID=120398 RepID=A0A485KX73_9STRA|nr:hypothetical protein As57867_013006 [Aphanomyces stellatus]VFT89899.1 Aste57867_13054 [Aphanomyces stellatus]
MFEYLQRSVARHATNEYLGHRSKAKDGSVDDYVWVYDRIKAVAAGFYQGDHPAKIMDDIALLRPTAFSTVPHVFKSTTELCTAAKPRAGYRTHWLFDRLLFSEIQGKLGLDRCAFVMLGSAPMADDVLNFFRVTMNCPVIDTYGLFETTALSAFNVLTQYASGDGPPLAHLEAKLVSVPEMGYDVADTHHGEHEHRLSVCVWTRGNLFSRSANQQIFVYGDSLHSVLVAVVIPAEAPLRALVEPVCVQGSLSELCGSPKVVEMVLRELLASSKANKLFGFVTIKAIQLHPEHFSVENNLLAPTFKLKRNECKKLFGPTIDALYAQCGDLVAGVNVKQG